MASEIISATVVRWIRGRVAGVVGGNGGNVRYWSVASHNTSLGIELRGCFLHGWVVGNRVGGTEYDASQRRG